MHFGSVLGGVRWARLAEGSPGPPPINHFYEKAPHPQTHQHQEPSTQHTNAHVLEAQEPSLTPSRLTARWRILVPMGAVIATAMLAIGLFPLHL